MFSSFKHLFYLTAFACAVVAQNIHIVNPAPGASLRGGTSLAVRLDKPASSDSKEVSVAIGFSPCGVECPETIQFLGAVLYSGPFDPESSDGSGGQYQDIQVTVPNWTDGPGQLNVAVFYLSGQNSVPALQLASTSITIFGNTG